MSTRQGDTETFAEILLELDSPRWSGTRFLLRAGKALGRRRKGVIVRFRSVSSLPFWPDAPEPAQNELAHRARRTRDLAVEAVDRSVQTADLSARAAPLLDTNAERHRLRVTRLFAS